MPSDGTQKRFCWYCGRDTLHDVYKIVRYFENRFDYTKGTWVFNRKYTCRICHMKTKAA